MKLQYLALILLFAGLGFCVPVNGQNNINPASVNVNELSDAQIDRIIREMQSRGLSEDQAVALAKAQGASQTQIDEMLARIQQRQMSTGSEQSTEYTPSLRTGGLLKSQMISRKAMITATEKNKKAFGFNVF